jgi:hypothetical protein
MIKDTKEELIDNVLTNAFNLLSSVEYDLGQKNMLKMWKILGILGDIQNDRFNDKYADVNYFIEQYK